MEKRINDQNVDTFIERTNRSKNSSFNCIAYVLCAILRRDGREGEVESRWLQQNDVVMCQTSKSHTYVNASKIDSLLFFLFFLFSFFFLTRSFTRLVFPLCALLHIQLYGG